MQKKTCQTAAFCSSLVQCEPSQQPVDPLFPRWLISNKVRDIFILNYSVLKIFYLVIGSKYESINAHMFSIEALCKGYDTDIGKGLTAEQAKENLKKYGPNKMKNMPECTMVKRDGEFQRIMTEDLVPGDITLIEGGSGNFGFIAGDIRIVNIMEPVYVESYFLYNDHLNYIKEMTAEQTSEDPLETNNLIFYGTSVFAGRCLGLVFQTGENMLLSDVCPDKLATPELPDSEDEEKGSGGKFHMFTQLIDANFH